MRSASLAAATALVLAANAALLVRVAWNRLGGGEAEFVFAHDEVRLHPFGDSLYVVSTGMRLEVPESKLAELGLDPHPRAPDFALDGDVCPHQLGGSCFVVLEFDGPASRAAWQEMHTKNPEALWCDWPRLEVIDVARHAAPLRARYPDRRVMLAPAVAGYGGPDESGRRFITLRVSWRIYLPEPIRKKLETAFRDYRSEPPTCARPFPYRIHLRVGHLLEPWVTRVEFLQPVPTAPGKTP